MQTDPTMLRAIFGGFGVGELLIIFLIVVLIFGAGKLPQLGEALGKGIRNFKTGMKKAREDDEEPVDVTPQLEAKAEEAASVEVEAEVKEDAKA